MGASYYSKIYSYDIMPTSYQLTTLQNARDDELVKLIKLYTQNTILGLIWFATPVFVTTISFAWYTMVEKKTLDAR